MNYESLIERPWELPDDKLLLDCRFEAFVARGPGGQKRHKTNAAVRYTHIPTSIHAMETESRSQRENKIHALRALRHKLAMHLRHEINPVSYQPPGWWGDYAGLRINPKNPLYPSAVAEVLDVMKEMRWNVSRAAILLGVPASALLRFLHNDPPLWQRVNELRAELGMGPLSR